MQQIRSFKSCQARASSSFGFLILYAGLSFVLTCSAQQAPQTAEPVTPGASANTSRLRMFGQNGASAVLFRGSACVKDFWSEDGEKASGGLGSAFSSFLGSVSNTSLGMPETEISRNLSSRDGLLSKAYFREYLIPADQPSSMRLGFRDVSVFDLPAPRDPITRRIWQPNVSRGCHGAISFVPGAGKDYEVAFTWQDSSCHASVNEVVRKGDAVELIPVPVSVAPDC